MGSLTLITGGIRSGKSRHALELAQRAAVSPKCFIATAEPFDKEMEIRIQNHKNERPRDFVTLEEPLFLGSVIETAQNECGLLVVDCLTLWVNNLLYRFSASPEKILKEMDSFLNAVSLRKADMIFVSNEVGLGLTPENALGRRYIDELGSLNQRLARVCDEVLFMISGIPLAVKGGQRAHLDF